jgi:hypothetical protein
VHTAPSGDRSVLHPLQHQRIWVGGKPMDAPEQRIAEAQVLLGLGTLYATIGQQEQSCAALSRPNLLPILSLFCSMSLI